MSQYSITFTLLSDATFGSGDGVAGLIDREVSYDRYGLPFLKGRTLKGLLREEVYNILDSLQAIGIANYSQWEDACIALLGYSKSEQRQAATLHYGSAQLPKPIRDTVRKSLSAQGNDLLPHEVLGSLTAVRRQTAITPEGLPVDASLRTMRVILRQTPFVSNLRGKRPLTNIEIALLAATVLAFRRAGTGRNRGRGLLQADLLNADGDSILKTGYDIFVQEAGL